MSQPPESQPPRPVAAAEEQAAGPGLRSGIRLARRRASATVASPHAEKFRLALAVLWVVAVGLVAMAIIAAQGGRPTTPSWSAFKPQFDGEAGAREIANYIAPGYRYSPAEQLSVIDVSTSLTGSTLLLKEGSSDNDIAIPEGNTLVYQFCGLGPSCSIPGKPSTARLLLVRLEAFELALYSLHYLHHYDNVVTLLPPTVVPPTTSSTGSSALSTTPPASIGSTQRTVISVAVSRSQVKSLLSQPVTSLFPNRPPALGGVLSSQAIATMDYVTSGDLFTPSTDTADDGTQYLVLSQLPAQ